MYFTGLYAILQAEVQVTLFTGNFLMVGYTGYQQNMKKQQKIK